MIILSSFKALVIPILEYACPVWNPYLVKHTKAIEAIQRRASRLICGPDKEYPERLLELKWDSLELRRQYLSLVQMYKIIFGYCDINCHHYFDIIGITRTRSKHEYKIRPKVARTNYFKYSFFNRYINDLNCMPYGKQARHMLKFDLVSCYFSAIPSAEFMISLIQRYSPFHML